MWHWNDGPDGWGWIWMSAMMLIVWVPLVFLFIWGIRAFARPNQGSIPTGGKADSSHDARDVARLAYARGELDRERYLQILEDLELATRPVPGH